MIDAPERTVAVKPSAGVEVVKQGDGIADVRGGARVIRSRPGSAGDGFELQAGLQIAGVQMTAAGGR